MPHSLLSSYISFYLLSFSFFFIRCLYVEMYALQILCWQTENVCGKYFFTDIVTLGRQNALIYNPQKSYLLQQAFQRRVFGLLKSLHKVKWQNVMGWRHISPKKMQFLPLMELLSNPSCKLSENQIFAILIMWKNKWIFSLDSRHRFYISQVYMIVYEILCRIWWNIREYSGILELRLLGKYIKKCQFHPPKKYSSRKFLEENKLDKELLKSLPKTSWLNCDDFDLAAA